MAQGVQGQGQQKKAFIPAHRFMLVGGILALPGIQALPKPPFYGKLLTALYNRVNKFFTEKLALALDEC